MTNIILTEEQQFVVDKAADWYNNSSNKLFQFSGLAGTGKSVVLNAILKRLALNYEDILPMAYTGQAAIIMRTKGIPNAKTCHSGLFDFIKSPLIGKDGKVVMNKTFNAPVTTWKCIPKDFTYLAPKLIVLDEAWMIPKSFRHFIDDTGIKVIATGDPGQLPPVASEPGYLVDGKIYMLTQLMRQAEESPLIYLAGRARNGLPIECGMYGNDVLVLYNDELDNSIISKAGIVLCGKNETRDRFNDNYRFNILGYSSNKPMYNDRVICRKNNWELEIDGIPLVNGLTGSITKPPEVGQYDGKTITINFKPDLLNRPFIDVPINYEYLKSNYRERNTLKESPYIKGNLFEYAYASTVHLSQGSEYSSGIYIEEFMGQDIQNALNYTAITRFKKQMIYVKYKPKYWTFNFDY